jgi:hypothetical protein
LCPGSFVDEALTPLHNDLLFSVQLAGRTGLVYVLLEHQSTVDKLMPFRLLQYMVRVWQSWLSEHPEAKLLPAMVPLVVHHSKTGWSGAVAFEELLDVDAEVRAALGPYVPRFRFALDDLSKESDEALRARAMTGLGRLCLWCLRHARDPEWLVQQLGRWASVIREVARAPNGMTALATVFRYIWEVHGQLSVEELRTFVAHEIGKDVEEAVVTTADLLREEGRQKGLEEGRKEGRKEGHEEGQRRMLLKLLDARFGRLPDVTVARVNAAPLADLETWAERVLTAPTLADVLDAG